MKKLTILLIFILLSSGVIKAQEQNEDLTRYVNPLIGTKEMGHVFPGACIPFGMVQLSPDTDTIPYAVNGKYTGTVYRYCAGYQYNDKTIVGFSHTHLSGTGHSDLGDFLVMPTVGEVHLNPATADNPESGYRSRFRHETEKAEPGYYSVMLDDYKIKAELTTTTHTGFHQYTFPESNDAHIILDMNHGIYNYEGKVLWSYIRVENDTLVTGYRITSGWARTSYIYFAMVFSKPFKSYGGKNEEQLVYKGFWRKFDQEHNFPEMAGKKLKAHFDFETLNGEKIKIKFAISAVSTEGALKNLQAEITHFDFERVRAEAKTRWQNELGKIIIDASPEKKITFYTSLYHTFINPIQYMDVDGRYRGLDHNIHQADGFVNYSVFSLWDTYRALHPLFTLIQPEITADMINSMLAHYDQSVHKLLPVWSHFGNENWCMIGYHAVPVIADAWINGIRGFDGKRALAACVAYMYNWAGQPWKTQERVHQIINTMYLNKPDGLCGNDDCGQMSAWYVFSSLGFYPVCPGSGQYAIGSPSVKQGIVQLGGGKKLTIKANNLTEKNIYIRSVTLNGKSLNKNFLTHDDIADGGELIFEMSNRPNKNWAKSISPDK